MPKAVRVHMQRQLCVRSKQAHLRPGPVQGASCNGNPAAVCFHCTVGLGRKRPGTELICGLLRLPTIHGLKTNSRPVLLCLPGFVRCWQGLRCQRPVPEPQRV